jgi:hypothetical protein
LEILARDEVYCYRPVILYIIQLRRIQMEAKKKDEKKAENKGEKKKCSLKKKFAGVVGGVALAGGLVVGGAVAVNGVDRGTATGVNSGGQTATLKTTEISPIFERQTYTTPTSHYWCWSVASIDCPIPIPEKEKPTYDALKLQIKP